MHTAKECCCGCSLRTGTLILLKINLVYVSFATVTTSVSLVEVQAPFYEILIYLLIGGSFLSIYVAGIYGVREKRPSLLIPFLGLLWFSLVLTIIGMVTVVIFGIVICFSPAALYNEKGNAPLLIFGGEIGLLIQGVIIHHFLAVVLSFYKQLKEEREPRIHPEVIRL